MAQCESWFKQDLKKPIKVQMLNGNLFSQDNQGNLIGVEVFDNGEPASLAGTVSANIIRADGGTVAATGTLSGNKCSVVLPAAAYAIPGFATIVIKLTYSGVVTTLLALAVTIYRSSTDTAVDPGTVMPSIQSLIQQINTAVASIPADYSSLWTSLAPAFSTDASYTAGQYVTYNSKVWRFNAAHSGEWAAGDVSDVKLGNELTDLKSAFNEIADISKVEITSLHQSVWLAGKSTYEHTYKITNNTNGDIGCSYMDSSKSTQTQNVGMLHSGASVEVTINNSSSCYLLVYASTASSGSVIVEDVGKRFPVVEKKVDDLNQQVNIIDGIVDSLQEEVPYYKYSKDSVGYIWIDNIYSAGTVLSWENTGASNILIGHYESNKTTRIGDNTAIAPGESAEINIPVGNVAYIVVYFYGAGSVSYHTHNGIYKDIDDLYKPTGNLWDEEIDSGKYLDNNGNKANASTPAWCTKNYISVSPSTSYYICVTDDTNCRIAQYDENQQFISFLGYFKNAIFTTGNNVKYIRFWKGGSNTYIPGVAIYTSASGQKAYLPYKTLVDAVARQKAEEALEGNYVIVGQGQTYTTVVAGFAAAIAQDKGCIILPGTYDLVSEGASSGTGIIAPKHVIGYGAKLIASLSSENWTYSAVNISPSMSEVIIEGLEIEVTNCRYCVHDEMENRAGFYHHVFKNCKMKHNSVESATLIRPVCIGGGFGNSGLVEIERCIFSSQSTALQDVNYHARTGGQTGYCEVKCVDSVFRQTIGITGNASTGFVNVMYVCGCLGGSLPIGPNPVHTNSKLVQWNNDVTD